VKILDKYLLKTFLITFTTVFVILFFIFILQTVWLFISELAGKDLDFILIVKFLLFKMPSIIPMVLPLSVLLSSIMTFGGLAENYEFAAMKSSGISLQRSMKPLTFFIVLLSIVALAFANNVIPYAEYKFTNFRRNIAQVKPAMAIVEGQFSKVGDYTIKVDKKSGENGNLLTGVIIHLKSPNGETNKTVIKAKRGELISNESSNTLKLVLFDGFYYEDVIPKKFEERQRLPFAKASFKKDIINIDLSKLNTDQETGEIANTNNMLSISELNYTLDSLNTDYAKTAKSYSENAFTRLNPVSGTPKNTYLVPYKDIDLLKNFNPSQKVQVLKTASSSIESTSFTLEYYKVDINLKQKNINDHLIALYEKFVIAFACILMFFIGAPLGSIIRKGGLGLPIVFAVTIFIIFHFINTFGKKVAQENGITPFLGTWMSTFVLGPLAIFLTYRAINDIGGMIDFDGILAPIQKLFQAKKPVLQPAVIPSDAVILNYDDEWNQLNTYSDSTLFALAESEKEEDENVKFKAITILSNRGLIGVKDSKPNANLQTTQQLETLLQDYQSSSRITLFLYALSIIMFLIMNNNLSKVILIILAIVMVILFLISLAKSQQKLELVGKLTTEEIEPGVPLSLLVGFPFYPIIYLYNTKLIKDIIAKNQ
jgi:lipopolysaccharide export system permease protein